MDAFLSALETILTPSPAVFVIGIAIIILIPIFLHLFLGRATPYTSLPSVLLVGPSGAGKTALLTLLERGPLSQSDKPAATSPSSDASSPAQPNEASAALTHTSQAPAAVELAVSEDRKSSFRDDLDASGSVAHKFLLVDTPGHGKLRHFALSRLSFRGSKSSDTPKRSSGTTNTGKLRAVIFVLDAAALADDATATNAASGDGNGLSATAAYLHDVLLALQKRMGAGKSSRAPAAVPVLIAANKQDLFTALPAALVRSNLEAELGRIRRTKSKGLLDSGVGADDVGAGPEEADDWLGEYGSEKFSFSQMREFDIEVDVIGGNIVGDGPGPDKWWRWIAQRV